MKKTGFILLALLMAFTLFSCAKKDDGVPKVIEESIPSSYTGEDKIQDTIRLGELEIVIKEKTFTINEMSFSFKDFKNGEKRTALFEDGMIDLYVTDGQLKKCVVFSQNNTVETEYNIEGKASSCIQRVYDEYGNETISKYYNADGKLQKFFTCEYSKEHLLVQKKEFNAAYDLVSITRYEYDEAGKLVRENIYGADLKLKESKTK